MRINLKENRYNMQIINTYLNTYVLLDYQYCYLIQTKKYLFR